MARLLVLTLLCVFLVGCSQARRYFPEEEKANDHKTFAVIPDDSGIPRIVDLRYQPKVDFVLHPEDITAYFYSRANPTEGLKFDAATFDGFVDSEHFDPSRKTFFVTHGWTGWNISHSCRTIRDALIHEDKVNVFVIDWRRPAHEFYTVARSVVPQIGEYAARIVDKLIEHYDLDSSNIILAGNSLGAHVVGATGAAMKNKPGFIMGMDPAQPLFYVDEPEMRLGSEDGQLVHIMHTNGGFLGFKSSIGHVDYYANGGGMVQPGCGTDLVSTCAHQRSVDYYGESIWTSGFKAHKCDSYEDYQNGQCEDNQVSYFGGSEFDLDAEGDFHFNTRAESPFALN